MRGKKQNKMCESVEEFLSRGNKIEYCVPATERLMALKELSEPISSYYMDYEFDNPDKAKKERIYDSEYDWIDGCYRYKELPRME